MQEYFFSFINWLNQTFHNGVWIIEIFLVVFITGIIHSVESFIYHRVSKRLAATKHVWDDTLLHAFHRPFGFLVWLLGLTFAAEIAGNATKNGFIFEVVVPLRKVGILILVAWFLLRFIHRVRDDLLIVAGRKKSVDRTLVQAVSQILSVAVIVTTVLAGLQLFGISITGLVAFGSIGTFAVAFSAKDLLANFFGAIMVYLDQPFKVGDWIRSPDKQIEGVVETIGWRTTKIRTFDKRPLYVPNNVFANIIVENPSRMSNRRIKTNVGIRYDDSSKMRTILRQVEEMLRHHEAIDTNQTLMVNLVNFGASSLDFMVYTFTKTTDWVQFQAIQEDVFLKIIDIIEANDAQCAFPTQTLHVPEPVRLHAPG